MGSGQKWPPTKPFGAGSQTVDTGEGSRTPQPRSLRAAPRPIPLPLFGGFPPFDTLPNSGRCRGHEANNDSLHFPANQLTAASLISPILALHYSLCHEWSANEKRQCGGGPLCIRNAESRFNGPPSRSSNRQRLDQQNCLDQDCSVFLTNSCFA